MEHSETDCRAVLARLWQYLDGEIAGGDCAGIEAHLEECGYCVDRYGFEREFKLMIRIKCGEPAPSDLAERIRARLREL